MEEGSAEVVAARKVAVSGRGSAHYGSLADNSKKVVGNWFKSYKKKIIKKK